MADHWSTTASWWQENFTDGADAEYVEQIIPMAIEHASGCTRILDVGCGEGQISRAVGAIGVDPVEAQLAVAHERGGPGYTRAVAGALPFHDGAFEAAIACLVFEHIDDAQGAIDEVSRVLQTGGRFLFFLNHPLLQTPGSGWIDDHILEEQYWRIGPYLTPDTTLEEVDKDVFLPFVHRPLSHYVNMLANAGLLITHMDEPAPPPGFIARAPEYLEAATVPRLLFLRCEKR